MKIMMTSLDWHNKEVVKELEKFYRTKKKVSGLEFELLEIDEWSCSYDTNRFIIFYSDIIVQLQISLPFTHF